MVYAKVKGPWLRLFEIMPCSCLHACHGVARRRTRAGVLIHQRKLNSTTHAVNN